ncbi:MAG: SDR family oxidoreductase [Nitrospinae bacterium]|nr:SDR family oxidoreductase [Nitrospinota bacterium]
MGRLEGKVAIVTGSSRGTGAAIAKVFAREGACVVINQVRDEGNPQAVLQEIAQEGGQALWVKADITRREEVERLVKEVEGRWGKVDILINNYVPSVANKPFAQTTWEDCQEQIDGTIRAAFYTCQAVLEGMVRRRWGRIVLIGSMVIHQPRVGTHAYAVAKSAQLAFVRNLAIEYGPYGITVNLLSPSIILTEEVAAMPQELRDRFVQRTPLGRIALPEEVARAALFLSSDDSSYVTGVYLPVNGGNLMV